jgi:hypothetical protein
MAMETVHFKIRTNTNRGKYLVGLLREMAKTGRDIEFEHIPNQKTRKAIKEAEEGKVLEAKSIGELFGKVGI